MLDNGVLNYSDETYVFTNLQTATATAPVPEPGSLLLFATGLFSIGAAGSRRRISRRLPSA